MYSDQKMIPGQWLTLYILRDGCWTSWFCCIAVWISSSDLAQHWIRPQRLSDPSVQLSELNCVNADWMIAFCLSVFILICSNLEFIGTRILFYVFWTEDDSWTRINAEHSQGWTLNILILLYSGLNFEFWFSSTLNPPVKALWSVRSTERIELC